MYQDQAFMKYQTPITLLKTLKVMVLHLLALSLKEIHQWWILNRTEKDYYLQDLEHIPLNMNQLNIKIQLSACPRVKKVFRAKISTLALGLMTGLKRKSVNLYLTSVWVRDLKQLSLVTHQVQVLTAITIELLQMFPSLKEVFHPWRTSLTDWII